MFFGMCNSLATFQLMMDSIFIEEIEEGVTIVYMDDILIYAATPELLERYTKRILHKLRDHDLFLKAKKCEFNKDQNGIFRISSGRRKNFHRPNQGQRICRMAYTNLCQRCSILSRIWKLLQEIHSRIFDFGCTLKQSLEEGNIFLLGRGNAKVF